MLRIRFNLSLWTSLIFILACVAGSYLIFNWRSRSWMSEFPQQKRPLEDDTNSPEPLKRLKPPKPAAVSLEDAYSHSTLDPKMVSGSLKHRSTASPTQKSTQARQPAADHSDSDSDSEQLIRRPGMFQVWPHDRHSLLQRSLDALFFWNETDISVDHYLEDLPEGSVADKSVLFCSRSSSRQWLL